MDAPFSPVDFSLEELAWLKASELLDVPPTPPPKDNDIFMQDLSPSNSTDSQSSSRSSSSSSPSSRRYISTSSRTSSSTAGNSFKKNPTTPPRKETQPADSPRSEWIYRRPKSPASTRQPRSTTTTTTRPRPRPQTGYLPHRNYHSPTVSSMSRTVSTTSTRTVHKAPPAWSSEKQASTTESLTSPSTGQFWTTVLHPRSRSERSIPSLTTIHSTSQLSLIRADDPVPSSLPSTPKRNISSPRLMSARPSSVSSSLSSASSSLSPPSSRSESPITPVSLSSSPYGGIQGRSTPYHRRHRTPPGDSDPLFASSCPPPSKSILTRTPSVSTKDSTHTINKSVKFAAVPTVHYARTGYWDVELRAGDADEDTMGINVDAMDLDADPFANYQAHSYGGAVHTLDLARLREMRARQTTPTPASERAKARGLRRLMSLSRAAEPTTGVATAVASSPPSSFAGRPAISTPYALGAYPVQSTPAQSTASLHAAGRRSRSPSGGHADGPAGSSTTDLGVQARLRNAPSMESVRSSRSAAQRSVRSLGSVKSTASIGGLKAWFGRTLGWAES